MSVMRRRVSFALLGLSLSLLLGLPLFFYSLKGSISLDLLIPAHNSPDGNGIQLEHLTEAQNTALDDHSKLTTENSTTESETYSPADDHEGITNGSTGDPVDSAQNKSHEASQDPQGAHDVIDTDFPPTYQDLKKWEADLPQHNLDLPFPEGNTGRYLHFDCQIQMLGWNNVLNELLMNSYLAHESNRAYVFQNYVWKPEYYPWPESKFREWPPRTPLNALISGPTAGAPWEGGDNAPRSVSQDWFNIVCPEEERRIINTSSVKPSINNLQGDAIFDHWKNLLLEAPERCIVIKSAPISEDGFPQVFDLWLWGTSRVLSLWKSFSTSSVSRLLETSPMVNAAVDRNEYLFRPRGPNPPYPISRNPYDRMLAIHIRRGDYKQACYDLAKYNSTFYSWNLLEFLPDNFTPPPGGSPEENTPENIAKYMEHCLPTTLAIVEKIRNSRRDYVATTKNPSPLLDTLYILTNDNSEWLLKLRTTLKTEGWHTIVTTNELRLDQEQTDVAMAVDMDIARRAAVFIGNGWSSFTSNIVHRRLVDGKEPISIRFY